ncbi:WD40 repeat-like protein [Exidia glandulosa HHB12029]|uniref:WD40 repeat-like protein n=1 Tax=Exidia glandulosa HHB12029 TaxID=1314781 RepID=A0A166BCG3_EXIGL|nr:WD40 repeat-like protein [Exidia glandulosa HHB12029]
MEPSTFTTTAAVVGTYRWMAPELILDDNARHSYESDIWACGCLIIEVQSTAPPYHHLKSDRHVILALSRNEIPLRPESMPDFLWLLVLVCCKIDPTERLPVSVLHALLEAEFYTRGGSRKARFPDLTEWRVRPASLDLLKPAPELRRIGQNLRSRLLYWPQSRREWNQHHYFTPSTLRSLAHVLSEPMEDFMSTFGSACVGTLLGHGEPVRCVAWFPTGDRIVFGARTVSVIDVPTGRILWTANHPRRNVIAIAISPTGHVVASCTLDCWVGLWDATTGEALHVLRGHTHLVSSISFSPDGSMLASGSEDRTIRFWSTATGETALALIVYDYPITSVAFSPDGARLASTSTDGTVSIWDPLTGDRLMNALDPDEDEIGPLYRVAFSPDGRRVATTGMDKALRLWDTSSVQLNRGPVKGHWQRITSIAYSPDGTRIASSSEDESIRLWDARTGEVVGRPLVGHCDTVNSVAYSPDGRWLASASDDGTIRLWDATDSWLRTEWDS